MKAILVEDSSQEKEFLLFPRTLYKNDKNYIIPLDKDIKDAFNPKKNKSFQHGICERYLFQDDAGKTFGKVAVFINQKYDQELPTGGIGFFDCIDNQVAANFIFDFCKEWLQKRGMEAMDGPINFGERDRFWGLLVEGFREPLYAMNYNPPYYQKLFENYGFQMYFSQLCFGRKVHDPISRVLRISHEKIKRNPNIKAVHLKKNHLRKFAKDFTEIYNKAWATHGDGKNWILRKRTVCSRR